MNPRTSRCSAILLLVVVSSGHRLLSRTGSWGGNRGPFGTYAVRSIAAYNETRIKMDSAIKLVVSK